MFICSPAFGGIITFDNITSDAGFSYESYNTPLNTIYNEVNGNIDSDNIENGSIADEDFSTAVAMSNWYAKSFGDWVYSGGLAATDATLTSDISALIAFIEGAYIENSATSHTYTASRDTYVDVNSAGTYVFSEVSLGASAPAVAANAIRLCKAVTSGTAITSVVDLRQTVPPQLRTYQDYKNGIALSRDVATTTKINVSRGEIELGAAVSNGLRRNIADVAIDFSTTGRGGLDTGSLERDTYYFIFALADDDNSTNFECIGSRSSTDATGFTGERLIGWTYAPTTGVVSPDSTGAYRDRGGDAPNIASRAITADSGVIAVGSFVKIPGIDTKFYSSGRCCEVTASVQIHNPSDGSAAGSIAIFIDGTEKIESSQGFSLDPAGASQFDCHVPLYWVGQMSEGIHEVDIRISPTSGANTSVRSRTIIVEEK